MQVIVADGIETLPQELWPPKEAILKLMMVRVKTKQMHQLLNSTLNQIVNALNAEGILSALLKGQGVAQNYRIPESRMCGDIDLYVGEKNYKKACEIIAGLNPKGSEGTEADHHMHLQVNGVEVEVHRKADYMPGKKQNRLIQEWTKLSIDQKFNNDELPIWDNAGTAINLASPTFDAFFVLHHAVRHMTTEGVGFRQICDWTMYLHNQYSKINKEELRKYLELFRMKEIWGEFGILSNLLGLPTSEIPFASNGAESPKTVKLLKQIFASGNFGRFDTEARDYSKTTYLKRKWRSFRYQSMRLLKLFRIFPIYCIGYWCEWFIKGINKAVKIK